MKRLVRKAEDNFQDDYLGQRVEIVYNRSKFFGFRGWVEDRMRDNNMKYRIFLDPQNYEEDQNYHIMYVKKEDAYKWMRIVDDIE